MIVENCPKCGGTHVGSYRCPFTERDLQEMGRASRLEKGEQSDTRRINKRQNKNHTPKV
jgi:hypothetical protein